MRNIERRRPAASDAGRSRGAGVVWVLGCALLAGCGANPIEGCESGAWNWVGWY